MLETQVETLKTERDKYRDHRDDLAGVVGKKVVNVMKQHMSDDGNISESSLGSDSDLIHSHADNSQVYAGEKMEE